MIRRSRAVVGVVAAAMLGLTACGSTGSGRAEIGSPAPPVAGALIGGGRTSGAVGHGHWTVLNFFASWCSPCRAETPQLVAFAAAHRASGDARVVGVVSDDSAADARSFALAHGVTWPLVDDPTGSIGERFGIPALPVSFVVDPAGRLRLRVSGGVTAAGLDAVVGSTH